MEAPTGPTVRPIHDSLGTGKLSAPNEGPLYLSHPQNSDNQIGSQIMARTMKHHIIIMHPPLSSKRGAIGVYDTGYHYGGKIDFPQNRSFVLFFWGGWLLRPGKISCDAQS